MQYENRGLENIVRVLLILLISGMPSGKLIGQYVADSDSLQAVESSMVGRLWAYAFGDYFYKTHADVWGRGAYNEYYGIKAGENTFAIRRIYLGHNFDINKHFDTELIIASEKRAVQENMSFYIKFFNLRWKNIWKGSDLIIGQSATPAFKHVLKMWGYRSIERSMAVIRGTQTADLGIALKGTFDEDENYGYWLMAANSTGMKAGHLHYPKFYGSLYGYFLEKKVMLDMYSDYGRFQDGNTLHSASLSKLLIAYNTQRFTVGVEGHLRIGIADAIGEGGGKPDTLNTITLGVSSFVRGSLVMDKLAYFARLDYCNPMIGYDQDRYLSYTVRSGIYDSESKEVLILVGLDYTPVENVHFMPNLMYNGYKHQRTDVNGTMASDYDLTLRMSFYFFFGL